MKVGRGMRTYRSIRTQVGFTYLALLIVLAVVGIGLTVASDIWVTTARRQKLNQLEWAGEQYRVAIGSYLESSPGSSGVYPLALSDLIEDRRQLVHRRHLRQIYLNPFTGKTDWDLVLTGDGRVKGVRAMVPNDGGSEWRMFVYQPGAVAPVGKMIR